MRLFLVGADIEENLALGILTAVAEQQGHNARVLGFNDESQSASIVEQIVGAAPDVVGLSMQFQHRADEFLSLSRSLRDAGYEGHITCGGQFPTLASSETLECNAGVDSIVLYDGEETLSELLDAIERGGPLSEVAGLALLTDDGKSFRTALARRSGRFALREALPAPQQPSLGALHSDHRCPRLLGTVHLLRHHGHLSRCAGAGGRQALAHALPTERRLGDGSALARSWRRGDLLLPR